MDYEIEKLWGEDTDLNVVKTWLLNGTFGGTHTVVDRFLSKLKVDETKYDYDYCDIEMPIDEIIGYKHDYKLDDPELEVRAKEIVDGLTKFVREVNANPGKYFSPARQAADQCPEEICEFCLHRDACRHNKPDFCDTDEACQMFDTVPPDRNRA
jgi:hypothetical protein